jgi:hypothetical protein
MIREEPLPFGLALAGLVSALLCSGVRDYLTDAAMFATALGVYLGAFGGLRSFVRLGAFVVACVVAYNLAILIVMFLRLGDAQSFDLTMARFFVGGGAGAFFCLARGMGLILRWGQKDEGVPESSTSVPLSKDRLTSGPQ